jgi:Putative zinc-finger
MTRHVDADRLSAWISGDLPDRDTVVVRAHVESCSVCGEVAVALRGQVVATSGLDHPEPPPTLWSAIEGALETPEGGRWSWRSSLTGALMGAAAVLIVAWGIARRGPENVAPAPPVDALASIPMDDPLLVEAERELEQAAASYESAAGRLRTILDRERAHWDPATRARVGDRLERLDEAVVHSRAVARRNPGDSSGAEMLFSAYRRQIDFLAEEVHRGSPGAGEDFR